MLDYDVLRLKMHRLIQVLQNSDIRKSLPVKFIAQNNNPNMLFVSPEGVLFNFGRCREYVFSIDLSEVSDSLVDLYPAGADVEGTIFERFQKVQELAEENYEDVGRLEEEMRDLENQVVELEDEIDDLQLNLKEAHDEIKKLEKQIISNANSLIFRFIDSLLDGKIVTNNLKIFEIEDSRGFVYKVFEDYVDLATFRTLQEAEAFLKGRKTYLTREVITKCLQSY